MVNNSIRDVISSFRESRGQVSEPPQKIDKPISRQRRNKTPYDIFMDKYNDLENYIDTLSTRDLVYYFREVSNENGYRYVIANIKKDMAIMKRLKSNYSTKEICGMIEFLYTSEQDYLDKARLSPNLLASGWVNTIYADTQLWLNDKYVPNKSRKNVKKHEWDRSVAGTENDTKIGVKL